MLSKSLTRLVIVSHLMTTTMPLGASGPGQKLPLFEEERAGPSMPRLNPVSSHPAASGSASFSWDEDEKEVGRPAASASIPSKDAVQWNALCQMWSSGGKDRDLSRAVVLEIAQKEGPHQEEALSLLSTSDDPEDRKFVLALTGPSGGFPLGTCYKNLPERLLTNPPPAGASLSESLLVNPGIVPSTLTTTSLSNPSAHLGSGGLFKSLDLGKATAFPDKQNVAAAISLSRITVTSVSAAPSLDKDALLEQAQSGDRRSLSDLMFLAEEDGDPWAQYSLGKIYEEGTVVKQDMPKALRLYKMAAAQAAPISRRARIALERLDDGEESLVAPGRGAAASSSSAPRLSAAPSTTAGVVAAAAAPPPTKPNPSAPPPASSSSSSRTVSAASAAPPPARLSAVAAAAAAPPPTKPNPPLRRPASAAPPPAAAAAAASSSTAVTKVPRPLGDGIQIPEIARGHEEVYRRFLGGQLIYRPNGDGNDTGMITLSISDLKDPLEGTFDLSGCGYSEKYLSISTGYRKGKIPANADKVEIWFTPWFVANAVKDTLPQNHYLREVTTPYKWDDDRAPVGIFWTWGGRDDLKYADYLTTQNMDALGNENLYKKWSAASGVPVMRCGPYWGFLGDGCGSHSFHFKS